MNDIFALVGMCVRGFHRLDPQHRRARLFHTIRSSVYKPYMQAACNSWPGMATKTLPDAVVTDKEADSFTFVRHIFSPVPTAFQKIRARLAIRTRIKSLYSILLKNPGYRRQAANDDAPL